MKINQKNEPVERKSCSCQKTLSIALQLCILYLTEYLSSAITLKQETCTGSRHAIYHIGHVVGKPVLIYANYTCSDQHARMRAYWFENALFALKLCNIKSFVEVNSTFPVAQHGLNMPFTPGFNQLFLTTLHIRRELRMICELRRSQREE